MFNEIDGQQRQIIINEIKNINAESQRESFFAASGRLSNREAQKQFAILDRILRAVFVPTIVANIYKDAATEIMFENNGEVSLKPMINKVKIYHETGR